MYIVWTRIAFTVIHVHHLKCEHLNNQDNQSTVPSVSGLVCVCSKYKLTLSSALGFAPWSNNIFIALTLPLNAALCSGVSLRCIR